VSELALEPYAAQQRWTMPRPLLSVEWERLFCDYLARLAGGCAEAAGSRSVVIGHIKLLALFDGRQHLRVSAVSATHPPTVSGAAPDGLDHIDITLNALVYGLPHDSMAALVEQTAAALAGQWSGTAEQLPITLSE